MGWRLRTEEEITVRDQRVASERMDPFDLVKNSWRKKDLMPKADEEAQTGHKEKGIFLLFKAGGETHSP